jgi:hypothetical protein
VKVHASRSVRPARRARDYSAAARAHLDELGASQSTLIIAAPALAYAAAPR